MATKDKLDVYPSRATQVQMKLLIAGAKRGVGLLRRKRDAIEVKRRELREQMGKKDDSMVDLMRTAIFSVAKANLLGTDFKPVIVADSRVATANLRKRSLKIVGVKLNYFELEADEAGSFRNTGLSCGGEQVQNIRRYFLTALREIIDCASLEYMQRMLKDASMQTNMRVNALEHVILPRLMCTHTYICSELEEFEREDFYRLKRSQAKQLEAKTKFTETIKMRKMSPEELSTYLHRGKPVHPVADTHFDMKEFEHQSLEQRLRAAYIARNKKLLDAQEIAKGKRKEEVIEFLGKVAVMRDPRTSKGSFIHLSTFPSETQSRRSNDSDYSDDKPADKPADKAADKPADKSADEAADKTS